VELSREGRGLTGLPNDAYRFVGGDVGEVAIIALLPLCMPFDICIPGKNGVVP
jgi:hypothetical protein